MSLDDDFRALFAAHFDDVWRFARRRCATAADADDVAADVFAVAWRRRANVPAGDEARLWLFGVAHRLVANQRRGDRRRDRLRRRLAGRPPDAGVEPDARLALRDDLRAALAGLHDLDRAIVTMRCWDGLGVGAIATVLDLTPNAVSIRLHRARRQLATQLGLKAGGLDGHVLVEGPKPPEEEKEQAHGVG